MGVNIDDVVKQNLIESTFYLKIKQFVSLYLSGFHGLFYFCDCQDFLLIKMLFYNLQTEQ